jgi:hypothetical protein
MLELVVLLTLISILLIILYYKDKKIVESITESFEDEWLDSCPSGYKSYYLDDGNVACCDGDLLANHCLGDSQCVLTGNGSKEMPNCINYIKQMYAKKSKEFCPLSMTNYYENRSNKTKGCTSDRLNSSLSGPISPFSPKCIIYPTQEENMNSINSCYNQKELDKFPCFGLNCKKTFTDTGTNSPPIIIVTFSDQSGMLRTAYTKTSVINYLNKRIPNWREQGIINLDKDIRIAEVAKQYYIDRTMQKSEVDF